MAKMLLTKVRFVLALEIKSFWLRKNQKPIKRKTFGEEHAEKFFKVDEKGR